MCENFTSHEYVTNENLLVLEGYGENVAVTVRMTIAREIRPVVKGHSGRYFAQDVKIGGLAGLSLPQTLDFERYQLLKALK